VLSPLHRAGFSTATQAYGSPRANVKSNALSPTAWTAARPGSRNRRSLSARSPSLKHPAAPRLLYSLGNRHLCLSQMAQPDRVVVTYNHPWCFGPDLVTLRGWH
jgi:hypothetical protein